MGRSGDRRGGCRLSAWSACTPVKGGFGQPLSLLMGMDPNVGELCIFDLIVAMVPPAGVAADLGHLERQCAVEGYVMEVGKYPIGYFVECLTGCHLVLVPAGVPRKPGMTRDDLFKTYGGIAKGAVQVEGLGLYVQGGY